MKLNAFLNRFPALLPLLLFVLVLLAIANPAMAQGVVNLQVSPQSVNRQGAPTLTWSTVPAATSCTAANGWSGTKAPGGTETLAAASRNTVFDLNCTWGGSPAQPGSATVRWTPPITNTDGSTLSNLAGYRVLFGTSLSNLNLSHEVNDAAATQVTIPGIPYGTYHFVVRARNVLGAESDNSNSIQRTIGTPATAAFTASASATFTVVPAPSAPVMRTVEVVWNMNAVPVFRLSSSGSVNTNPVAMVPVGRQVQDKIGKTWKGFDLCRITVASQETVNGNQDMQNLVAPCA